jgi:hypothetical protein
MAQLVLEISLILLRVGVFLAFLSFFMRYLQLKTTDPAVLKVRSAMFSLTGSNLLIYGILIYGRVKPVFGLNTQNIPDITFIFIVNLVAGVLALSALRTIKLLEEGKI